MSVTDLYDADAERACVGWLLARPNHWHLVTEVLPVHDIFAPVVFAVYEALLAGGYQTVQDLAPKLPNLTAKDLARWAEDARDTLSERSVARLAVRVANLALRRRVYRDGEAAMADAADPTVDEVELVSRVRERADRAEAPDAPPNDPAKPVDVFMAGVDDAYDWIVDGLIERRDRMLVTATGGVGKSTLLRQFALAIAAGRNPFTGEHLPGGAKRVLLLDLENSERQVRRKLRGPLEKMGEFNPDNLRIVAKPQVMDVTTPAGWRWLAGQAAAARPDVIIGGPVYRLYEGGDASKDMGGRDKARMVVTALDRLRDRYNCALIMEAHPPKGSLSLSPHGSAVWEWWPEFGIGLAPSVDGVEAVDVRHWRYPRDERDFPDTLLRGGAWGFTAGWRG